MKNQFEEQFKFLKDLIIKAYCNYTIGFKLYNEYMQDNFENEKEFCIITIDSLFYTNLMCIIKFYDKNSKGANIYKLLDKIKSDPALKSFSYYEKLKNKTDEFIKEIEEKNAIINMLKDARDKSLAHTDNIDYQIKFKLNELKAINDYSINLVNKINMIIYDYCFSDRDPKSEETILNISKIATTQIDGIIRNKRLLKKIIEYMKSTNQQLELLGLINDNE